MRSASNPVEAKRSFIELARRRQIIDATIAAVAEEGYAGASLGKVAKRAKISKSVVLYHFEGKDDLVETTLSDIFADLGAFLRPRTESEPTARGQLRAYIEAEFAYLEKHRERLLAIAHILSNHRDEDGVLYLRDQAERVYLEAMESILARGQNRGEFRSFAVKTMAVTVLHAVNGALQQWATDSTVSLSDYAHELVTLFDVATRKDSVSRPKRRP